MRYTTRVLLRLCVISFAIGVSIVAPIRVNHAQSATDAALSCQQILTRAMGFLKSNCGNMHRNSACYGNPQISAEFSQNAAAKFSSVGDTVAISDLHTLNTSPLQLDSGLWGLALLKLQVNIPDTLPGQNVTFLVYGDTRVENASGDMQTFYFSTGLGNPSCSALPDAAILVSSPNHIKVSFTANDVRITMASTIILQARSGQAMTVQLIEGHAEVATALGSQTLVPGQRTSITLGGTNGLSAQGLPAIPVTVRPDRTLTVLIASANQVVNPSLAAVTGRSQGTGSQNSASGMPSLPIVSPVVQTAVPAVVRTVVPSIVPSIVQTVIPPVKNILPHGLP